MIEQLIKGLWLNPTNNDLWTFFEIEKNKKTAMVIIAGTGNPTPGLQLEYEIIWVNDDNIFINFTQPTIARTTKHQIWVNSNSLRIAQLPKPNEPQEYWDLSR